MRGEDRDESNYSKMYGLLETLSKSKYDLAPLAKAAEPVNPEFAFWIYQQEGNDAEYLRLGKELFTNNRELAARRLQEKHPSILLELIAETIAKEYVSPRDWTFAYNTVANMANKHPNDEQTIILKKIADATLQDDPLIALKIAKLLDWRDKDNLYEKARDKFIEKMRAKDHWEVKRELKENDHIGLIQLAKRLHDAAKEEKDKKKAVGLYINARRFAQDIRYNGPELIEGLQKILVAELDWKVRQELGVCRAESLEVGKLLAEKNPVIAFGLLHDFADDESVKSYMHPLSIKLEKIGAYSQAYQTEMHAENHQRNVLTNLGRR
jgi:hypothetical protein